MITYNEEKKIFKLDTNNTSYIIGMSSVGHLMNFYWGSKIPDIVDKHYYDFMHFGGYWGREYHIAKKTI